MSSYLFEKHREERCVSCLRSTKYRKWDHDIILCVQGAYYKGPQDSLSVEEQKDLSTIAGNSFRELEVKNESG